MITLFILILKTIKSSNISTLMLIDVNVDEIVDDSVLKPNISKLKKTKMSKFKNLSKF